MRVEITPGTAPDEETARRRVENLLDGAIEQGYIDGWSEVSE